MQQAIPERKRKKPEKMVRVPDMVFLAVCDCLQKEGLLDAEKQKLFCRQWLRGEKSHEQ